MKIPRGNRSTARGERVNHPVETPSSEVDSAETTPTEEHAAVPAPTMVEIAPVDDEPQEPTTQDETSSRTRIEGTAPLDGIWTTLSVAGVAAAVISTVGEIVWCNALFAELSGTTADICTGMPIDKALGVDRRDRFRQALIGVGAGKAALQRLEVATAPEGGKERVLAISASITRSWADEPHVISIVEDLTPERRRRGDRPGANIQQLRNSTEDPLTGLPNRATLESMLDTSLRTAERDSTVVAVMTCDIDGFSLVNDRLGHEAGDEVLKWVAGRLSHTLRHHDTLGRISGDEFVVVAENVPTDEVGHLVARRLAAAISEPILIRGIEVRIGVTIGFTLARQGVPVSELLMQSNRTLMAAKRAGKGRSMSYQEMVTAEAATMSPRIDWNELSEAGPADNDAAKTETVNASD